MNYLKIGAIIVVLALGSLYIKTTANKIEKLSVSLGETTQKLEASEKRMLDIQKNIIVQSVNLKKLEMSVIDSGAEVSELSKLLRSHDLENLAEKKPKLIENRINNATKAIFDDITNNTQP